MSSEDGRRPAAPADKRGRRPRRTALAVALAILAMITAGVVTPVLWKSWTLSSRIVGALPDLPTLNSDASPLQGLLQEALSRAREGEDPLAAVAELGRLTHANSHLSQARACWEILSHEEPGNGRWTYYRADVALTLGRSDEARALLEATTERSPGYAPAWLKLGDLTMKTGDAEAARQAYDRRLALVPGDPYALLGLARMDLHESAYAAARERLEAILDARPDFSTAHNLLAEVLAAEGNSRKADEHRWAGREAGRFRPAEDPWLDELADWCYDPGRLRTLGTMADQTGDGERAIHLLERAIELSPDDPYGYAILGDAYLGQGNPAAARDVLEEGLAIDSEIRPEAGYYVVLAEAYRDLQQPEEAIRVIREGMSRIGESYELYDALGVALGQAGAFEEAVDAFAAALLEKPHDTVANYNMANALLNLRREDEALFHLRQSLIQQPTYPKSLFMLARYEFGRDDLDAAEEYLRPLYTSHPEQEHVRKLMAAWLLRKVRQAEDAGDGKQVESYYREGLDVDPESPEFNVGLGVVLLIDGRADEALPLLEHYRGLKPDDPQGALFLGQALARTGRFPEARAALEDGASVAESQGNARTAAFCREILSQLP